MGLGTSNNDAIVPTLHHVEVHVFVVLFIGAQRTVPLNIRNSGIACEVIFLNELQEFPEPVKVIGTVFLVNVVSDNR